MVLRKGMTRSDFFFFGKRITLGAQWLIAKKEADLERWEGKKRHGRSHLPALGGSGGGVEK